MMLLGFFIGVVLALVLGFASLLIMRRTGFYTGPLIMSPLRAFRLADRPVRLAQILSFLFVIPYLALFFAGQRLLTQLLFGLWLIVVGAQYRKSRRFPYSKINPRWTGVGMILTGAGIVIATTVALFLTRHSPIVWVALGIDGLGLLLGLGAYVMAFRRPLYR